MTRATAVLALLFTLLAHADECPTDHDGWRVFTRRHIEAAAEKKYTARSVKTFVEALDDCRDTLAPKDAACLVDFERFAREVSRMLKPGHSLGASMSDVDYYAKVPYGDMMELPAPLQTPQFLAWMDKADGPAIDAALKRVGEINKDWIAFPYESQHLPTPDGTWTMGRFFIYVPGEKFDRYFQFGIRLDPAMSLPNGLSVVTVDKTVTPPVARLKDFWRKREDGKVTVSTRLAEQGAMENCYNCHKNALLPITPKPSSFDATRFGEAMRKVNAKMRAQGATNLAGQDLGAYGPAMGPEKSPVRTAAFLKTCTAGRVGAARMDTFAQAMTCARCHDGKSRGVLNFPTGLRELPVGETMTQHYVVNHRLMPKGVALDADERRALVDCLNAEYYGRADNADHPGLLKAWLFQTECWNQ